MNKVDGSALEGQVIESMTAKTIDFCEVKCFLHDDCVSYNFGPSGSNDDNNICQLNNSTDRSRLKPKAMYTYAETEVLALMLEVCLYLQQMWWSLARIFIHCSSCVSFFTL